MSFRYPKSGAPVLSRSSSLRALELGGLPSQPRSKFPISPPETEQNAPSLATVERVSVDHRAPNLVDAAEGESPEDIPPYMRHTRRRPSIQYHQSNMNVRQQAQRMPRWLILVMPPSSLNVEPVLGHTLAMGPPGRFQSGILMPLFPTMYAQLTAIAKEFNLPSTSGICIYLHISKPDLNMSPRISDDTWQLLWSSYLNAEDYITPDISGLPICGKIEFDIDIRKARWYESWLNRQERQVAYDTSIPASIAQTMPRWYNDHRETNPDEADAVATENVSISVPPNQQRAKPVPRPLTLSNTNGASSNRILQKYRAMNSHDGEGYATESIASGSKRARRQLSPVVQMEESTTAKQADLFTLVRNWRAATPMAPVIPRTKSVPGESQDPDTLDSHALSEIDMNEFQWSVSSPGPNSPLQFSPQYGAPLPSVNIEGRLAGSVVLTPSVATSFGPDDSYYSPMPTTTRPPSPDIACRMIEDSPYTPTTATSWGAPLSYPSTPASIFRSLSPDIAARHSFSRPATPSTVTSWGAPSIWEETPDSLFYRAPSPDLGLRGMESVPLTPSTATSWGPPEVWPSSPVEEFRVSTPDISSRAFEDGIERNQPYQFVWPFFPDMEDRSDAPTSSQNEVVDHDEGQIIEVPTPAREVHTPASEESPITVVWTFFNTSPLTPIGFSKNHVRPNRHTKVSTASIVHSADRQIQKSEALASPRPIHDRKPLLPYLSLSKMLANVKTKRAVNGTISVQSDLNVVIAGSKPAKKTADIVTSSYSQFNLSPAVYPSRYEIQGLPAEVSPKTEEAETALQSIRLTPPYPFFDLYPAGYPHLVIYPVVRPESPVEKKQTHPEPISVRLPWSYPYIEVYPPVYPCLEIYPPVKDIVKVSEVASQIPMSVTIPSNYPHLVIYPAVYPFLEIYPPLAAAPSMEVIGTKITKPTASIIQRGAICTRLPRHYPLLEIYPPGYPHIEIYPPVPTSIPPTVNTPSFSYPDIIIYEPLKSDMPFGLPRAFVSDVSVTLESRYPFLCIYPPVYPHLDIYPPVAAAMDEQAPALGSIILPGAVCSYPNICIYPPVQSSRGRNPKQLSISVLNSRSNARGQNARSRTRWSSNQRATSVTSPISPRYTRGSINIFDALESSQQPSRPTVAKTVARPRIKPQKSHQDLHQEAFAQLAPHSSDIFAIVSTRVDSAPPTVLAGSRTVTMTPPVPSLPNEQFSVEHTVVDGIIFTLQCPVSKLDKSRL